MLEFDKNRFAALLRSAPEKETAIAESEYSPYVQELIDIYKKTGQLDLSIIDWDTFELKHVTPPEYQAIHNHITDGWTKGFIHFCRKVPSLRLQQRTFF